jgi:S-adenosyl-L-methionine hydrolase (adenosine-forming)
MGLPITFTTDYGHADDFAGVCRAVIAKIAPGTQVIDITHGIARHDVREAAAVLCESVPYGPRAVHLAVVDPGVGGDRRAVALRTATGRYFVGPDNGLLLPAADRVGGVVAAHELTNSSYMLEPVSRTFHARDIFAPAAAHLVNGTHLSHLGDPLSDPVRLSLPSAQMEAGRVQGEIIYVDSFGNCVSNIPAGALPPADAPGVRVACGNLPALSYVATYGMVPEGAPLALIGSHGYLEIAVRHGNAAAEYGIEAGTPVTVASNQ